MPVNQSLKVKGVTCYGCVDKLKQALARDFSNQIVDINVDFNLQNVNLRLQDSYLDLDKLNQALTDTNYILEKPKEATWLDQYWIVILFLIISVISEVLLKPHFHHTFQIFMAFWLILFSVPKLLNLQGFAGMFAKYDFLAARSRPYAFAFPFLELGLGLFHLNSNMPHLISYATLLLFGLVIFSILIVILQKQKVACACLGTSSKMQVGYVTLIENLLMVLMSGAMIIGL